MSYHAMGAGPGPTTVYKVDAPFPWGKDTEIVIPVQQMVDDAWAAAKPHIDDLINDVEGEAARVAPDLARKVFNDVVMPDVQKQMEIAFAKAEVLKEDALKGLLGVGGAMIIAVGLAAWWVKKG